MQWSHDGLGFLGQRGLGEPDAQLAAGRCNGAARILAGAIVDVDVQSVNLGLAIVACPAAVDAARDGSRIAIDTAGAVEVDGVAFDAPVAAPLVLELGAAGGLVD